MCEYICKHINACMYEYIKIWKNTYMHLYIYIHIFVYTSIYTYIYIYSSLPPHHTSVPIQHSQRGAETPLLDELRLGRGSWCAVQGSECTRPPWRARRGYGWRWRGTVRGRWVMWLGFGGRWLGVGVVSGGTLLPNPFA